MNGDQAPNKPGYWDRAGEQGYGQAMFRNSDAAHMRDRLYQCAIDIAAALGVPADCGRPGPGAPWPLPPWMPPP